MAEINAILAEAFRQALLAPGVAASEDEKARIQQRDPTVNRPLQGDTRDPLSVPKSLQNA